MGGPPLIGKHQLECLRRYPLFNLLRPAYLVTWLSVAQELTVATGETLFQEGAAGIWAYLVLDGHVRVVRRSPQGRELTLGRVGPGEVCGEYALLPPHRNTATGRAAGPARLLQLPLRSVLAALPGVLPHLKSWLRLHGLLGYLRDQAFLAFMSAPSALAYLDRLQPVAFRALRTVQADGLGDDCWYFIQSGQVALHLPSRAGTAPPRELGAGDCFGEGALLGREGLPLAVALSDTRCLCLQRAAFVPRPGQGQDVSGQSVLPQVSSWRKPYAWVGQQEAADCGVAALAMVAQWHGLDVAVDGLRRTLAVGPQGLSLMELQRAAEGLGLASRPARVGPEQLGQVALPAIAHYQGGHYVVLYELGEACAVVGDPAAGIVRVSRERFAQTCSGNLLLVRPPPR